MSALDPFGFNRQPALEPSASCKAVAYMHRELYLAHLEQGFTAAESVIFTKFTVALNYGLEEDGDE